MGGGFGNSPATSNNYDSKPKSSNRRNIDEQTLIPVTCKMIVESTDSINGGCVLPDGREPYLIKIIGAVKEVVKSSTNCMYVVEDGTGSVQIKEFIDDSSYNEEVQQQRELASQDGTYIRVVGKLSSYEGNKQVVANSLRKVSGGGNEFTHHLLEVVYSSEKHKKGETMVGRPNMQSSGMMQPNSTVPYGQQNTMTSVRNAPAAGGRDDTLRREVTDFIISSGGKIVAILFTEQMCLLVEVNSHTVHGNSFSYLLISHERFDRRRYSIVSKGW
jgi:replication factor A2